MIYAFVVLAVVYGGSPCSGSIRSDITPQLSECTQYKDVAISPTARLVIYSVHEPEVEGMDVEHRVYVSLLRRHPRTGAWYVIDRKEITESLLNNGETGFLERLAVLANEFTVDKQPVVDVSVLSGISGNGGISRVDDILYVVRGNDLHQVVTLEGTAGWWKSGSRLRSETLSTLRVYGSLLVWSRTQRSVHGTGEATKVTCREDQRIYRWHGGAFVPDTSALIKFAEKRSTLLQRFELHTTLECENEQ